MDVKTWKDYEDSVSFTAVLDERGRISIPASLRRALGVKFGSLIAIKVKSLKRRIEK